MFSVSRRVTIDDHLKGPRVGRNGLRVSDSEHGHILRLTHLNTLECDSNTFRKIEPCLV